MSRSIEHIGVVQSMSERHVSVLIEQQSACAGCHAKSACMAADKSEKLIDAIPVDVNIGVGDSVIVFALKKLGMKAVMLIYVIPFLLMLLSMIVADRFTDNELIMGGVSIGVLIPHYLILAACKKKINKEFQFYARKA